MSKLAVCSGNFYVDWAGFFKCDGSQWNVDESHLYNQANLGSVNSRIDNVDVLISSLESRLSTLEGITNGSLPSFDPSMLDPVIATQMFTAGFLLCITPWLTFFGFAKILQAIREF